MISHSSLIPLLLLVVMAMWMDIRSRRIPNWLTFSGIISGFLFHLILDGIAGLQFAGIGFALGLALLFIPFYKGGMGAGDVKFLAMIGTWMGVDFLFPACLWMGVIGAGLSLYYIWRERVWQLTLIGVSFKGYKTGVKVPYGVAIGLGAIVEAVRNIWLSLGGITL